MDEIRELTTQDTEKRRQPQKLTVLTPTPVRIDAHVYGELKERAERMGLPVTRVINLALRDWLRIVYKREEAQRQ